MAHSTALAEHVQERVERLESQCDRIVSCHVVVEVAGHHHSSGDRYRMTIHLGLPGHELLVTHDPADDEHRGPEDVYATADRAFAEASRQLEHWMSRQRERRHDATSAR